MTTEASTEISPQLVDRVSRALGNAPESAYTAPLVYPWSLRSFRSEPMAARNELPGEMRLYVHIPFCNYRCTFCFYAVRAGAARAEKERYVAALERELESVRPGTTLAQLFVGGGTPTALPADLFGRALGAIFARMTAPPGRVHTVEASPESISDEHLDVMAERGIGRVSMGVESLDGAVLDAVRRRHGAGEALAACRRVAARGFRLNVDLIYGLPGQSPASFRRDLEAVAAAGVHSVCLYALRLNENTPVGADLGEAERLDLPNLMRWRAFVARAAEECGFEQARPYLFERCGRAGATPGNAVDQLGIGMSARSQLGSVVYRNHERTQTYMERVERGQSPVEGVFALDVADRKTQFVARSLGNGAPLDRAAYARIFGGPIEADFGQPLGRLGEAGLIEDDRSRIALTDLGRLVYDRVLLCFYPERAKERLASRRSAEIARHV